jgi:uncharacterized protein (DUF433 family)
MDKGERRRAMTFPASPYIYETEYGTPRITGTRVGLASIVVCHNAGESPEQIVENFPTVTLAQAYGAIAYYLENKQLIDDHLAEVDREFKELVKPLNEQDPELYARLAAARRRLNLKSA